MVDINILWEHMLGNKSLYIVSYDKIILIIHLTIIINNLTHFFYHFESITKFDDVELISHHLNMYIKERNKDDETILCQM